MKDQSGVLSAAFAVIAIVGARVDVHDALGKVAVLSEVRVKPVCVVVTAARDHRTQNAYSEPSETRRCMRPMHTTYAADPKAEITEIKGGALVLAKNDRRVPILKSRLD